jgi:hypothetical protein
MANDIKIIIQALTKGEDKSKLFFDQIDAGSKRAKLAMEAFNAASGNGQQIVHNLTAGVKDLVGAYVGISAAKAAFTGMVEILKNSEQAQFNMTASVQAAAREFEKTGSLQYWQSAVKELSKELVVYSEGSIKNAISRTVDMSKRLGLTADEMKVVIKRTADLSSGKTDLEGGIERVTAALRGEAEASEYLGLTLNEEYVKSWNETHKVHQKAWKDLTELEKAQVRYQIFLEQTNAFQGRAAESVKTFGGALELVKKTIEDAVANNQDLAAAMKNVAQVIRDNAESIGAMASTLIEVTAKVAEFAIQWKEVLLVLGGVWAVTKGVSILASVIKGLDATMKVMKATSAAASLIELAGAANTARIAGVGLSAWMTGGLAVAAAFAAQQIIPLIQAYMDMKKWEDAAREASRERQAVEDKANKKAQELGQRLGMNISTLSEFNRLVKEGKIAWDAQTNAWGRSSAAAQTQARAMKLSEDQMKSLESTLKALGQAYDSLRARVSSYYDVAAEKAKLLSANEMQGTLAALDIQRQKTEAVLNIARTEADERMRLLRQSGASEQQQAEISKEIANDLKNARTKTLEDYQGKLRSAFLQALTEEKRYAEEVKRLQAELSQARMSYEDRVREIKRRGMTEDQQYADRQKQTLETLKKAQDALLQAKTPEGMKEAVKLFEKAQQQAEGLSASLGNNEEDQAKNAQRITETLKLMEQAQKGIEAGIKSQEEYARRHGEESKARAEEFQKQLDNLKTKIDEINSTAITPTAEIKVDSREVDAKLRQLDGAVTESTHIIRVKEVREASTGGEAVPGYAGGGWPRLFGKLSGWGGGDRIRALLEAGEFIVRKEAVAKYGAGLFHALNSMRLDIPKLLAGFALPQIEAVPRTAYATGGPVGRASDLGTLTLRAGDTELPVLVQGLNPKQMVRSFEQELAKMRLTRS